MIRFASGLLVLFGLVAAGGAGEAPERARATLITIKEAELSAKDVLAALTKQAGAPIPTFPADLLEKNPVPRFQVDWDHLAFWSALEALSRKTGLEPVSVPEDPYPRLQIGLRSGFWEEPHVVCGPLVIFANEVERSNTVELRKKDHQFDRELTVSLSVFAEPGLPSLWASDQVKVLQATDENGQVIKPVEDDNGGQDPADENSGNGLYAWNLAVSLASPAEGVKKIAKLKGLTHLRLQTASERVEVEDVLKAKNVARTVAGVPFTFRSLKKADIEYILQLNLRREKTSDLQWKNLHHSVYNGRMALFDKEGRLVAARGTENGGDYGNNRIDATLRFVREHGVSDPNAGEPYKLVWEAPTQSKEVAVEFELSDLPIPE